jgi:hypothetical protein
MSSVAAISAPSSSCSAAEPTRRGRAALFNRAALQVRCNWRPRWILGSEEGPRFWFSWFVWTQDWTGFPTTIRIRRHELIQGGHDE